MAITDQPYRAYASQPYYGGYWCGCGQYVNPGSTAVHTCPAPVWTGYCCAGCGARVTPQTGWHTCPSPTTLTFAGSPCLECGQQAAHGAEHDCPARKPLPPVADAVARVRGWLAQAQAWLERSKI